MNKDKDLEKTKCAKKRYRYTAAEIAELTGVSESYVKKLRSAQVNTGTPVAQLVLGADVLMDESANALLEEVERVLSKQTMSA
jgi:transcriptional regulator with XRE-family HTH domain